MECWHRSQYELQTHDTMDNSQEQLKKESERRGKISSMQWHKNGMTATLAENFSAKRQSRPEKRICIMKQQKKYVCV